MTEWQPIETAPMDGTLCLVTGFDNDDATQGRWMEIAGFYMDFWREPDQPPDYPFSESELYQPTHWMPIPELPAPESSP